MERISERLSGHSDSGRFYYKTLFSLSVLALLSIGSAHAQVSDSTGALTIIPLSPTADCQGQLVQVTLNPYLITSFLFIPTQSFLTITGDLIFPASPVSQVGFGGQVLSQIVAVQAGGFASATANVAGFFCIGFFCFPTTLSTGAIYVAPQAPCGCQGLRVQAVGEVLPINPGVVPDTASTTITASISSPAPAGGCAVTFSPPEPIFTSGGHEHDGSRSHGSISPTSCTIQEGITFCTVLYTASEVSGQEVIVGTSTVTGEQAVGTVTVRVPELGLLGASSAYRLTGAFGEPGVTSQHTDNHNGTGSTMTRLIIIANDHLNETGYTLGINDMSLPLGGLFDIDNNWVPPHDLHREGKSADIDRTVIRFGDPTDLVTINCQDDVNLKRIVELNKLGVLICESGGRKHIEFP